ncbi:calcium-binding protein [Azospirillum brasilense]|uniref:calcium-binding protein n=1 Tax=Azospirillum argentinense TaxID=2970906 RepID=UPI00190EC6B2|nr:calcium-binding protein [Azospirillum argentinense]MBK3803293.1 calcium-binding protein [Azospirillum argentinense]
MTIIANATEGADTLQGTSIDDTFKGLGGNDQIFGGAGADTITGNAGDDMIYADSYGGTGADTEGTWNKLFGDAGDDVLVSGAGFDDLWGGVGNDTLTGGAGWDWFVFEPGSGVDAITDFTPGSDQIIVMSNMNGAGDPVLSQNADGTVVDFGAGNAVLLQGVALAELPADTIVTAPYSDVASFYSTAVNALLG